MRRIVATAATLVAIAASVGACSDDQLNRSGEAAQLRESTGVPATTQDEPAEQGCGFASPNVTTANYGEEARAFHVKLDAIEQKYGIPELISPDFRTMLEGDDGEVLAELLDAIPPGGSAAYYCSVGFVENGNFFPGFFDSESQPGVDVDSLKKEMSMLMNSSANMRIVTPLQDCASWALGESTLAADIKFISDLYQGNPQGRDQVDVARNDLISKAKYLCPQLNQYE